MRSRSRGATSAASGLGPWSVTTAAQSERRFAGWLRIPVSQVPYYRLEATPPVLRGLCSAARLPRPIWRGDNQAGWQRLPRCVPPHEAQILRLAVLAVAEHKRPRIRMDVAHLVENGKLVGEQTAPRRTSSATSVDLPVKLRPTTRIASPLQPTTPACTKSLSREHCATAASISCWSQRSASSSVDPWKTSASSR